LEWQPLPNAITIVKLFSFCLGLNTHASNASQESVSFKTFYFPDVYNKPQLTARR